MRFMFCLEHINKFRKYWSLDEDWRPLPTSEVFISLWKWTFLDHASIYLVFSHQNHDSYSISTFLLEISAQFEDSIYFQEDVTKLDIARQNFWKALQQVLAEWKSGILFSHSSIQIRVYNNTGSKSQRIGLGCSLRFCKRVYICKQSVLPSEYVFILLQSREEDALVNVSHLVTEHNWWSREESLTHTFLIWLQISDL